MNLHFELNSGRTGFVKLVGMPIPLLESAFGWVRMINELIEVVDGIVWRKHRSIATGDGTIELISYNTRDRRPYPQGTASISQRRQASDENSSAESTHLAEETAGRSYLGPVIYVHNTERHTSRLRILRHGDLSR